MIKKSNIINKSNLINKTNGLILSAKEVKKQKVYEYVLSKRGESDYKSIFSNEVFYLAEKIKQTVEKLAVFLKIKRTKRSSKNLL